MNQGTVFDFPDAKGIVICGDIHGEFNQLVFKCCVQYGMTDIKASLRIQKITVSYDFERDL